MPSTRAIALLLALLAASGCLASLRCPGCGNVWTIGGEDPLAYDALGRALPGGGVRVNAYASEGLAGFAHPRLDAAWGDYALVSISWQPRDAADAPSGYADLSGGAANLSVTAPDRVPEEDVRAAIDVFLAGLTTLDAEGRARWADAMLANRTVEGEGRSTRTLPNGTIEANVTRTHRHGATLPVGVLRVGALFEDAVSALEAWAPREDATAQGGHVEAAPWTFSFAFPHRLLRVEQGETRLMVQVNAHGGLFGALHVPEPVREAEARDLLRRLLEDAGGTGADVASWTLHGTLASFGPPPTRANPVPTPTDAAGS